MRKRKDVVFSTAIYSHEWVMCIEINSKSIWFTHDKKIYTHKRIHLQKPNDIQKKIPIGMLEKAGQKVFTRKTHHSILMKRTQFPFCQFMYTLNRWLSVCVYLTLKRARQNKTRVYENFCVIQSTPEKQIKQQQAKTESKEWLSTCALLQWKHQQPQQREKKIDCIPCLALSFCLCLVAAWCTSFRSDFSV